MPSGRSSSETAGQLDTLSPEPSRPIAACGPGGVTGSVSAWGLNYGFVLFHLDPGPDGCRLSELESVRIRNASEKVVARLSDLHLDVSIATDVDLRIVSVCPIDYAQPWSVTLHFDSAIDVTVKLPKGYHVPCSERDELDVAGVVEAQMALPNPGGTCSASQLVLGAATTGFEFSTFESRHVFLDQPLRNADNACVLNVPGIIGVAPATGPFQPVNVGNVGYPVCNNDACSFFNPTSHDVGAGQTLKIDLGNSWYSGATDQNRQPLPSEPPCFGPIADVTRLELPLAEGALTVDLSSISGIGGSVPWRQVCSAPMSMTIAVEP